MRRFVRLALSLATIGGLVTMASPIAHAAPGDVTTTTVTLPAAVQGLTSSGFTSARDGGMYYAYASGNDFKIFKTKPDGSQDTAFGVGGIATLATGSSSSKRLYITSDLDGKWWATVIVNNVDAMVFSGAATGAPAAPWTVATATQATYCAAGYPSISATTWGTNNQRVYVRRNGGVWLKIDCSPRDNTSAPLVGENLGVIVAMSATGVRDTTVPVVATHANYSSSSRCYYAAILSDPTSVAPQPELYVIRTEHNVNIPSGSTCTSNQGFLTAAGITGYSVVSVLSNGTATSKSIASAGDATDGILAARLDPGSRIVTFNTNLADLSTMSVRRIKTDGTLDTTVGTNGVKTLSIGTAPAGQASVTASAIGIVTTPTKVYFSVLIADSTVSSYGCQSSTPNIWGYRMAMVSPTDGFASGFGTNGIGGRVTVTAPQSTICTGAVGGGMSVDTDGQPRMLRYSNSTTFLDVWAAPPGANGGGEGGTGSGGPTTDTGGAASKGDGLQVLNPVSAVDNNVYAKLPATIGVNTALHVLTSTQAKSQVLVARTPKVCFPLTTSVVVVAKGTCSVAVKSKQSNTVLRTLYSKAAASATVGTGITTSAAITFSAASWALSDVAKAQIAKLVTDANTASRIVVVGHAGSLYDNTAAYNEHISLFRAAAVKAALQKAGVKTAINVVALGSRAALTATKSETAQAQNRRVVLYFYP